MKKILIILLCLFILVGCNEEEKVNENDVASVVKIPCSERFDYIDNGAVLIDVRTSEEYNTKHYDNAININSEVIKYSIKTYVSDLNTPIIVYCQSGRRSAQSAKELVNLGYTTVYDMGGVIQCEGVE